MLQTLSHTIHSRFWFQPQELWRIKFPQCIKGKVLKPNLHEIFTAKAVNINHINQLCWQMLQWRKQIHLHTRNLAAAKHLNILGLSKLPGPFKHYLKDKSVLFSYIHFYLLEKGGAYNISTIVIQNLLMIQHLKPLKVLAKFFNKTSDCCNLHDF